MTSTQLFALAYAGGTASTAYTKLQAELAPLTEFVPLDLPGRGRNAAHPPGSVDDLVEHLWETIVGRIRPGWGLLGHSYGGGLAFEIARRAEAAGCPARVCFVSGRSVPSGRPRQSAPSMTDNELLARVAQWGALPREFQKHQAFREMAIRRLREDVTFSAELHSKTPEPLKKTAIHALAGSDDPVAPAATVHAWTRLTYKTSTAQTFAGEHFFLFTNADAQIAIGDHFRRHTSTRTQRGKS